MTKPTIRLEAGRLEVNDLAVEDQCVVDYVGGFDEEQQADAVLNCLQLGARALSYAAGHSGTTTLADVMKTSAEHTKTLLETVSKQTRDAVAHSAEELPKKLADVLKIHEKDLAKTLDPESASSLVGKLRETLVSGVVKETSKLADQLDLSNPKSQLSQLRYCFEQHEVKIEEQLTKLAKDMEVRAAASAVRRKTTGKGIVFEDVLEAYVANESRPRRDVVSRTSRVSGLDGNDAGDILIEIEKSQARGPGLNVAIEARDAQTSCPALIRDVDKAMSNRGAAFGIGVTTNPEISKGSSLILPVGDNKLIVCAPQIGDDEFELLGVAVALEMARWKSIMSRVEPTEQMDLNRINAHVEVAFSVLSRFTAAKRKMASVKTSVDDASTYLDEIRTDLEKELRNLRSAIAEEIEKSGETPSAQDVA